MFVIDSKSLIYTSNYIVPPSHPHVSSIKSVYLMGLKKNYLKKFKFIYLFILSFIVGSLFSHRLDFLIM